MSMGWIYAATLSLATCCAASAATLPVADGDTQGLINAIHEANATEEPDTISLAEDGVYTLTEVNNTDPIRADTGLPRITTAITIEGNGATIERAPTAPSFRLFLVDAEGSLTLERLTLQGGATPHQGGGALSFGDLTITMCTIRSCAATDGGGGVYTDGSGAALIRRSSFVDNTTPDDGGGLFMNAGTLHIETSTFSGNLAGVNGGGVYTAADFSISSATIFDNHAVSYGGGLFAITGTGDVSNSVIAGNTAMASPDVTGAFASQGHNLIGFAFGAFGFGVEGDLVGREAPIDPMLAPLRMNGGPTPTHVPLLGSPAIDSGGCVSAAGQIDQRGAPRLLGAACDIGAVERSCVGDINLDGFVDSADLAFLFIDWGRCEADSPADLNHSGCVDSLDLAVFLGAWGQCD